MVTLRKNSQTLDPPANPNTNQMDKNGQTQTKETQKISSYEQLREERIKENLERMQKLGIFDLSLKFKSVKPTRKNFSSDTKTPRSLPPFPPPGPTRRSSRLQNVTPVSYSEVNLTKKDASLEGEHDLLGEGSRPEVYTEEHEKQLGNTEMSWTLFVDGYGQDGKRIYDPVRGKTCHQCRQKTLGHRTECSKCGMVQGQFCGDCLYMRYGEHVLEAKQNPDWICPVCRGICNCSLCRQAKGWPPTGSFYRKISQLGFKSVAHYLIQTRRSQTDSDKIPNGNNVEATSTDSKKSPISDNDHSCLVTPKHEDNTTVDEFNVETTSADPKEEGNTTDDEFKDVTREEMDFPENKHADSDIASKTSQEHKKKSALVSESSDSFQDLSKPESEAHKEEEKLHLLDYKHSNNKAEPKSSPRSKRKSTPSTEPNPDSIGARLRQRRRTKDSLDVEQDAKDVLSESETKASMSQSSSINPSAESIGGRLRIRCERR